MTFNLFLAVSMLALSGCSSIPGVSIISDINDLNAIRHSNANMPVEELREIASRPLVQEDGISYDIGLMRRGIVQGMLSDIPGLTSTKQLALERAVRQDTKATVIGMLAATQTNENELSCRAERIRRRGAFYGGRCQAG